MGLFVHLLLSVLSGYGMAVFIVEKKRDYPARIARVYLKYYLAKIHPRAPKMLGCTVCTSFWTTLFADLFLFGLSYVNHSGHYFTWPVSGFVALGLTWTIIDVLISLQVIADKSK
jgi:hypothetical protein